MGRSQSTRTIAALAFAAGALVLVSSRDNRSAPRDTAQPVDLVSRVPAPSCRTDVAHLRGQAARARKDAMVAGGIDVDLGCEPNGAVCVLVGRPPETRCGNGRDVIAAGSFEQRGRFVHFGVVADRVRKVRVGSVTVPVHNNVFVARLPRRHARYSVAATARSACGRVGDDKAILSSSDVAGAIAAVTDLDPGTLRVAVDGDIVVASFVNCASEDCVVGLQPGFPNTARVVCRDGGGRIVHATVTAGPRLYVFGRADADAVVIRARGRESTAIVDDGVFWTALGPRARGGPVTVRRAAGKNR